MTKFQRLDIKRDRRYQRAVGHRYQRCTRATTGTCTGGCADGHDCFYETLAVCAVCGSLEGALLPFCPERRLTHDDEQRHYQHFCAGTGPFASLTFGNVDKAKHACYDRLHPRVHLSTSAGARRLYDAVCELWCFIGQIYHDTKE